MIKTAYHATNNAEKIFETRKVIPARMENVFLCADLESALLYAERFGCSDVLVVSYDTRDVERTWRPAYIDKGKVIKLKVGCQADVIRKCK